jgi:hypothetical protein
MNDNPARHPSHFLRQSLRANALFSMLSGLAFALASAPLAALLGDVPPLLVFGVGLQLLFFAAGLVWLASRSEISVPLTIAVIVADGLWVLGTAVVVYADLFARQGEILALVLADVVLVLAILQSIGVRRITALRVPSTPL